MLYIKFACDLAPTIVVISLSAVRPWAFSCLSFLWASFPLAGQPGCGLWLGWELGFESERTILRLFRTLSASETPTGPAGGRRRGRLARSRSCGEISERKQVKP